MNIENDVLNLEEVVTEFIDVGESIEDLSLIRFTLVKDIHWNSLELNLSIYGAGDPDTEYPVLEIRVDPDVLLHKDNQVHGLSSQKIIALFDNDLLELIIKKNIPLIFNQGDKTETHINLTKPGNKILLPMLQ